jgi:hypothetical protein
VGSVRTPIIGRPRPLPGLRRATQHYTLNYEEPVFAARGYFPYVYLKSQWLAPCMMVCVRSSLSLGS